jgi:hypothetical protein
LQFFKSHEKNPCAMVQGVRVEQIQRTSHAAISIGAFAPVMKETASDIE